MGSDNEDANLISAIAGLKGENLATAVLDNLLSRSIPHRTAFFGLIARHCSLKSIALDQTYNASREFPAEWEDGEQQHQRTGRIDLLIQTESTVIGIENKFYAIFGPEQPACYLETLEKLAAETADQAAPRKRNPLLVILAPSARQEETEKILGSMVEEEKLCFLNWPEVIKTLVDIKGTGLGSDFIAQELKSFVESHLDAALDLQEALPRLQTDWKGREVELQKRVIDQLIWPLLDDCVKPRNRYRNSASSTYYGWYLYPNPERQIQSIWIGFMKKDKKGNSAGLHIGVNPPDQFRNLCAEIEHPAPQETDRIDEYQTGWVYFRVPVEDDEKWCNENTWSQALEPLNRLLQSKSRQAGADG